MIKPTITISLAVVMQWREEQTGSTSRSMYYPTDKYDAAINRAVLKTSGRKFYETKVSQSILAKHERSEQ
jgi:hypothetical protein